MKTKFLLLNFCWAAFAIKAQSPITLNNSNMPGNGDTLRYTGVQLSSVGNYSASGVNFSWNFSNMVSTTEGLRSFKSSLQTPYALFFLSANAYGEKIADTIGAGALMFTKVFNFYKKQTTPNAFIADGLGITFNNIPLPSYYTDKDELYNFPMTFPKYDSSTFRFSTLASTLVPIRYSKTGYRVTKVDGWGTITTPYGTENCLRLVTTQYSKDSIRTSIGPVTIPLGFTNNQRSYQWLTATSKIPFFEVSGTVVGSQFTPTQARYRGYVNKVDVTGISEQLNGVTTMLYPNPVKDLLFGLDLSALNTEIYNERGELIKIAKSNEQGFDVSHLTPGLYFIKKVNYEKTTWYKFVKE
jgi:hypothetical protein